MDSAELLQALLSSAVEHAIIVCGRDGRIELWNAGAERTFGYSADEIVGHDIELIFTVADRIHGVPAFEREIAGGCGRSEDQRWLRRRDGSLMWAEGATTPVRDCTGAVIGFMKIVCDATGKKRDAEETARLARADGLTGLANRAEFRARLVDMTAAALRHDQLLIVQLIDLDRFKDVNDRCGHAAGDALLQQAAQRMRAAIRETDFIARLGGDEFVVLQPDAHDAEVGGTVADKLVATLSRPFRIEGHEVSIGASIGISVFPKDAADPDRLLRKADLALYKVKAEARGGYHYFTDQLDYSAHRKSRDLAQLRRAVRRRAFSLQYQPVIDACTGAVIAVEALLRCDDPLLSRFRIDELVALATDAGLMRELGHWATGEACAHARGWRAAGLPPVKLCLNLCPFELNNPNLPDEIGALLAQHGLVAQDVEIEVTEQQLFECEGSAGTILADLRARGIALAVDDFGVGYSSLSHLSRFNVDKVKLDRSFIRDIPHDAHSCAVASAIIGLARTLNLEVVIEGVESAAQAAFFADEPCKALQGYYFSRPLGADAMAAWLAHRPEASTHPMH